MTIHLNERLHLLWVCEKFCKEIRNSDMNQLGRIIIKCTTYLQLQVGHILIYFTLTFAAMSDVPTWPFSFERSEITRLCWWFILIPCRLLRQVAKFTPPVTCGEASYFIVMGVKLHALANTTKRPISWKGLGNSLIHFNTPLTCDGEDKSTHINSEVRLKRPIGGAKSNFRINCKSQHSNSRPKLWYHVKLHALANAIKRPIWWKG